MHDASRIEAVTVYRRGARVSRVVDIALGEACPAEVRIEGLPLCLDDASIRARVEAAAGDGAAALPVAAELRVGLSTDGADPALEPADDALLEKAEDEVERLERLLQAIAQDIADLPRLGLHARPGRGKGQPPERSPTAARLALLTLRDEIQGRLLAEQSAAHEESRRAKKRLAELRERDRRSSSARGPRSHELRKIVIVSLRKPASAEATSGERARLVIEYNVPGARWAAAYTLRLDAALRRATLQLRAQIAQKTGEDWTAARVTLSTAAADAWTELPELASKRIGRKQPRPAKRGWRAPPAGADELYADYDRVVRRHEPPAMDYLSDVELSEPVAADAMMPLSKSAVAGMAPGAAAPPPPPIPRAAPQPQAPQRLSPPMPAAMPMPLSARKSAGLLGNLFSAGGAGAPASAEASLTRAGSYQPEQAALLDELMQVADERKADAPPAEPPGRSLDYGRMRMAAPRASMPGAARGALTVMSQNQLYLELVVQQIAITHVQIESAIAQAAANAEAIDEELLPLRHHLAWSGSYDYAYRTDAPIDVPSDGEFHNVAVTSADGKAGIVHVVVPRESTDVYRLTRIDNPMRTPLVAGPVDVYVGTDYLLTSDVRSTPATGELTVGLGVDQGVKVARNTRFREESAGLMGGSLLLDHRIEVEVANHSGRNIELDVRERLPVIREEEDEVKIEVKEVSPKWEVYDPEPESDGDERLRGGHRWRVSLADGEKKTLAAAYLVKIAAKHELVGGNRREA